MKGRQFVTNKTVLYKSSTLNLYHYGPAKQVQQDSKIF